MNDDADLLRRFAETHDESPLRQLIERRIGFVYAINLRRLRDPHLAEEATQAVFVALARKAAQVARCPSVMAWLHRSSRYESRNLMRASAHRLARETEAQRLGTIAPASPVAPPWHEIEAVLDDALGELGEADRAVLLARFFSHRSYAEIGAANGCSENAARMRVDRALDKLRVRLLRRGFTSTAAVLATALPSFASAAVPTGLAATVTTAALGALGSAAGLAAFFALMKTTKIAVTAAAVLATGAIGFEFHRNQKLEQELHALDQQHTRTLDDMRTLTAEVERLGARARTLEKQAATSAPPRLAAPVADVTPLPPPDVPGIIRQAPAGWHKTPANAEAYEVGTDALQSWGGMPSAYVRSTKAPGDHGFGGMMQSTSAESYKNQRVRLTGWVKTQDANDGGGHLWMRIDGPGNGNMLQFDNMGERAPKGTADWQEYSVVLDVPEEAKSLNYGFFVQGQGQMWVNGLTLQPVGADVPTTNTWTPNPPLAKTPVNLGFVPATSK